MNDLPIPAMTYPALDEIIGQMKISLPTFTDEEKIKEWYVGLYRTESLNMERDLSKFNEDGSRDYSLIIAHNHFVDIVIKVFKTKRTVGELIRLNWVKSASAIERAKIAEEDKKYQPKFKEREEQDKRKQTVEEKKIQEFVTKFGISRESAEKIVFKAKPEGPISTKPSDAAKKLGLSQEDINKLILGK